MNKVNKDLIYYIEKNIFPNYYKNGKAHQIEHIKYVIERSFQLSKDLNVNRDMIYVIASYHDCGYYIDKEHHETVSAQIMFDDVNLQRFFSMEEMIVIKEAIEDHRASLQREPRSIYGKIVSSADRDTDINLTIQRVCLHGLKKFPNYTINQHIQSDYEHLKEKFGLNGYVKMYLQDELYENYLHDIRELLSNKDECVKKIKSLIGEISTLFS